MSFFPASLDNANHLVDKRREKRYTLNVNQMVSIVKNGNTSPLCFRERENHDEDDPTTGPQMGDSGCGWSGRSLWGFTISSHTYSYHRVSEQPGHTSLSRSASHSSSPCACSQ